MAKETNDRGEVEPKEKGIILGSRRKKRAAAAAVAAGASGGEDARSAAGGGAGGDGGSGGGGSGLGGVADGGSGGDKVSKVGSMHVAPPTMSCNVHTPDACIALHRTVHRAPSPYSVPSHLTVYPHCTPKCYPPPPPPFLSPPPSTHLSHSSQPL